MHQRLMATIILTLFIISLISGIVIISRSGKETTLSSAVELSKLSMGKKGEAIGIVKVYGIISTQKSGGTFTLHEQGTDYYVNKIKRYAENPRVKAIVIRVNSPGGSVGASQEIYNEILKARESGKKVVVSMGDVAASGGYYISSAADLILANPGTVTGSIGVVVGNINFQELMTKWGIKMNIIKSGKYKDILSSWRDMTEEEKIMLQDLVNRVYLQFLTAVANGRGLEIDKVREIADGRIFTGEEALALKLIDQLGGFQEAIQTAADLAGIEGKPDLIEREFSPWDVLLSFSGPENKEKSIAKLLGQDDSAHLPVQYLYYPPHL